MMLTDNKGREYLEKNKTKTNWILTVCSLLGAVYNCSSFFFLSAYFIITPFSFSFIHFKFKLKNSFIDVSIRCKNHKLPFLVCAKTAVLTNDSLFGIRLA